MALIHTHKTKEEFINEMNERISIRKNLLDVYNNIYLPTLKKFDGKVYNIRFIKALRKKVENNKRIYISEKKYDGAIEIEQRRTDFNYTDCERLCVKCITNNEGRIDDNATLEDELHNKWLENFKEYIEEYQNAIDNYDACMEQANELANAINAYNDLPYPFRQNVNKSWLSIY
jgi:hypothetical protein